MLLNKQKSNEILKSKIKENAIFAFTRIGSIEAIATILVDANREVPDDVIRKLSNNAGVYNAEEDGVLETFYEEYLKGIKCGNFHIMWDFLQNEQNYLFPKYAFNSIFVDQRTSFPLELPEPWTYALEGKKVLVIHPYSELIENQYENKREDLFANKRILPKFELSTYKSVQSICGVGPHSNWAESLNIMKDDISKLDFDIALLACGGYGLPLVAHIKNEMNKPAIYVGGILQTLFGIKGTRWDNPKSEVNKFYNKHWVRPDDKYKPQNYKSIERGCYW